MIQNSKQFQDKLETVRHESEFLQRLQTILSRLSVKGGRALSSGEIEILQKQGNRCADWSLISVADGFSPEFIANSWFSGSSYLGVFSLHSGIWNSVLTNAVLFDNALVYGNARIVNTLICENAAVYRSTVVGRGTGPDGQDSGKVSAKADEKQDRPFGIGTVCNPGLETGGRSISLYPDLDWETAVYLCARIGNKSVLKLYMKQVEAYMQAARAFPYTVIDADATVEESGYIRDSYIGASARLRGVLEVSSSLVASKENAPAALGPGVVCRQSVLKPGVVLDSGTVVESCGIFEHSSLDRHAKAVESLLGPQIEFAEGEITASFAGPFTGFHHQALLISAYWPEGKGNIGCGANVGSNHTSRMPDQEIRPGEGMFFGLGCSVKFPSNFEHAPYTVIATGTITMPQKMEFPFSCIVPSGGRAAKIPPGYNRLLPGWCLYRNMYMCIRGSYKYKKRNVFNWEDDFLEVFRKPVIEEVLRSQKLLHCFFGGNPEENPEEEIYTDSDIPELGKNYSFRKDLALAFEWYTYILHYYCCKQLFSKDRQKGDEHVSVLKLLENEPFTAEIFSTVYQKHNTLPGLAGEYKNVLHTMEKLTINSREKDVERGKKIIDDYETTHPPVSEDPVITDLQRQHEAEIGKIRTFFQ